MLKIQPISTNSSSERGTSRCTRQPERGQRKASSSCSRQVCRPRLGIAVAARRFTWLRHKDRRSAYLCCAPSPEVPWCRATERLVTLPYTSPFVQGNTFVPAWIFERLCCMNGDFPPTLLGSESQCESGLARLLAAFLLGLPKPLAALDICTSTRSVMACSPRSPHCALRHLPVDKCVFCIMRHS